jgi:cell division protein FtsN
LKENDAMQTAVKNERGGIISKLFFIPAFAALLAGAFLIGYYTGRTQGNPGQEQSPGPLPDVVTRNIPKPEDMTFFKTLSDKENKTVSIDLKPNQQTAVTDSAKKEPVKEKETAHDKAPQAVITKPVESKIEKKPVKEKIEKAPTKQDASQHYTLQISSHQEKSTADEEVRKLKYRGFAATVVASELPGKGKWYRVRVGRFADKASAEKLQQQIRDKAGMSSILVLE